jgi:hypothetical protein
MIEERTTRTYLVGTIALASFALVIVGVSTSAVWHFGITKAVQWRDMRAVHALAEQQRAPSAA